MEQQWVEVSAANRVLDYLDGRTGLRSDPRFTVHAHVRGDRTYYDFDALLRDPTWSSFERRLLEAAHSLYNGGPLALMNLATSLDAASLDVVLGETKRLHTALYGDPQTGGGTPQSETLLEKVISHLKQRGYTHPEPIPMRNGGKEWTHPDWGGATDRLFMAIADCFEREADENHRKATTDDQ